MDWYFVENDPGVSDLSDPMSGLNEVVSADVQCLVEGKAIGTALLSANVRARDNKIRPMTLGDNTVMRTKLRKAATNVSRQMRPLIREDAQGVPRGQVRQAMRKLMREWRGGQLPYNDMRLKSSQKLREFYEQMRQIGRAGAGLSALGANPRIHREEEDWFRSAVREELGYWHRFLAQIHEGNIPEPMIWRRLDSYVKATRSFFESSRVQALPDNVLLYWIGPKKNDPSICEGCALLMEWSPFPKDQIPAVPRDGSTPCNMNCRHKVLVRVSRSFNAVIQRSNQLDRLKIETRQRPSSRRSQPRDRMVQRLLEVKNDSWHGGSQAAVKQRQAEIRAAKPGGKAGNPFKGEPRPKVPTYKGRVGQLHMVGESLDEVKATPYTSFDAVPYATMDLRDVARLLQRAAENRDADQLVPLLDRLLSALEHTVVAVEGRPRGRQVALMFRRAFVALADALDELPESCTPKALRLQELFEGLSNDHPGPSR